MSFVKILVQAIELAQATNDMNQAMEVYRDSVEAAKSAADELASKWEGAAKDAFVAHQENAYKWHNDIIAIVLEMISTVRKAIDVYNEMEDAVKSLMKG